jgi:hypothetical protein
LPKSISSEIGSFSFSCNNLPRGLAPISDEILFGKLSRGGKVVVDYQKDDIELTYLSKIKNTTKIV